MVVMGLKMELIRHDYQYLGAIFGRQMTAAAHFLALLQELWLESSFRLEKTI